MPLERLGFAVDSTRSHGDGWHLTGSPEHHPRHWPRPGERFDRIRDDGDRERHVVDLVVVECSADHAVVTGSGGELLRDDEYLVLTGEREIPDRPLPEPGAAGLAAILGDPDPSGVDVDWAAVEAQLGVTLPADYKEFVGTFGAATIDDHLVICAPADLVDEQDHVHVDDDDRPEGLEPGDRLIAWGSTPNGDLLLWHAKPGVPPESWPVLFTEEGPVWQAFPGGFTATVAGLLTGDLQSWHMSDRLGGPHSYR
ncbi:hypothetical protein GCM10010168_29310 [Actinoplanes ianthinogenes]|uniref:Knr4/Smi1-like domain-containing protein n=1 Tax=Actinoplanes ianthinogenes TaxID=122358 RepID=A0ABM7LLN6_9ACTN|nr:SMI1/KNR4 family protein [Actinoplanes ianthinogenes]BCJ40073.1 hypothetical protein Aiant_07300 [Actinoplanes ianthinogenes]GGR10088.1 hypothetical protein GCM10010168_29310 [Actinoplanes ianthinogenes]